MSLRKVQMCFGICCTSNFFFKAVQFIRRTLVSSKAYHQRIHKVNIPDRNINLTYDFKLTYAILVSAQVLLIVRSSKLSEDKNFSGNCSASKTSIARSSEKKCSFCLSNLNLQLSCNNTTLLQKEVNSKYDLFKQSLSSSSIISWNYSLTI